MKNRSVVFIALLSLMGCTVQKPVSTVTPKNNRFYEVEYLFEHDGCKIYRFQDGANRVYFTNCRGETVSFQDSTTVIRNSTNMKSKNR